MNQQEKTKKMAPTLLKTRLPMLLPYAGLVLVIVVFAILSDGVLLSQRNLTMVFNQLFPTLLCCIGATFYWAHGSIDLSIGSVIGVAGIVIGTLVNGGHIVWGLLGGIVVALVFALVNGLLVTVFHIPSFLSTLCVMFIANGIHAYFTLKQVIYISFDLTALDQIGLKLIVAAVLIIVCYILFEFSTIGKNNVAIGGNIRAAHFSGIKVSRERIIAFLIGGVCVGIAAFFMVVRMKSVTSTFGGGMQFNVMTSMVLGGTVIGGGKNAKIANGVIGAITYTLLTNGLQLAGMPTEYVYLLKGIVFIGVVALTFKRKPDGLLPV